MIVTGIEGENEPSYFYDPGGIPGFLGPDGDPNGYFAQGLRDTITLTTGYTGSQIYVMFEEFVMSDGDTLWIFDGDASNIDTTANSTSLLGFYSLVNSPREVYASGQSITFVFHSDSVDIPGLRDGWKAQVYAYNPQPEEVIYGDIPRSVTCNAIFYDAGGPQGDIIVGSPTHTEFISPVGTHIKCEFTLFSVGGVLKIYDGQYDGNLDDGSPRLIGQFSSSTLDASYNNMPPTLFSSNNALCFVYDNGTGTNEQGKPGWRAEISCVDSLLTFDDPCPKVVNHPIGLYDSLDDPTSPAKEIVYDCSKPVVLLRAEVVASGPYSYDYTVTPIDYNNHLPFDIGDEVPSGFDDQWLEGVPLNFTFMFFGKPYTTVYPGTNGLISMTYRPPAPPPSFPGDEPRNLAWYYGNPFNMSPPYNISGNQTSYPTSSAAVPFNYNNCVYGVYEDVDCRCFADMSDGLGMGKVRSGVATDDPLCRKYVFNYLNVGKFGTATGNVTYNSPPPSSSNPYNTYQMVLYEGTNIIEVFVKHRKCCPSSNNNGEGIIAIQNSTSSQIVCPLTRRMTSWNADEEGWRFTPITPLDEYGSLTWYVNSMDNNHIYSYDEHAKSNRVIAYYPPDDQDTIKIYSVYRYKNALNEQMPDLIDSTIIYRKVPKITPRRVDGLTTPVCPGDSVFLTVDIAPSLQINPVAYAWGTGDTLATDTVLAPIGIDTATYYLTVKFENSCTRSDSVKVAITQLKMPTITGRLSVTDTDSICVGMSYTLEATHPDTNRFKWSTVADTTVFDEDTIITVSPKITTDYVATATMVGDCDVSDTFTVVVMPLPQPSFTAYPTEIFVENGIGTVQCTNTSAEDYPRLEWNFGDAFSNVNVIQDLDDPSHDYTRSGFYTITMTAIDSFGCVDSIKARVSVKVPYFFYIPNAFTPDGDGLNETFAPQGEGVDPDHYSMQIYDRHGMLIFSTKNPYDYWDGRNRLGQMCPEGVYVYIIRLVDLNGEEKEYPGTVTLVR